MKASDNSLQAAVALSPPAIELCCSMALKQFPSRGTEHSHQNTVTNNSTSITITAVF